MPNKPRVFVVILNWNRPNDTLECLRSIRELRTMNFELRVVIVDNGSSDQSVERINKFIIHDPRYIILVNEANFGFVGGNNIGIRYALEHGAEYVMVLNNDTIVDKNLITGLLEVMKKHKDIGAVSPKIYFAPGFEFHKDRYKKQDLGKVIWYVGGIIDWNNVYGTNRGVDEVDRGQYEKTVETGFATGACSFMRSSALKEVGVYDKKYFMYFEDADLSERMKKKNWKVLYSPKGIVWHKVAQSSKIGGNLNDYYITRNRMLFGTRYAPFNTKLALIRESFKFALYGRPWQKIGARDFYLGKFEKGSYL